MGDDCHVFYLKFIKKNASLFSPIEDFFSFFLCVFQEKKKIRIFFSCLSVTHKLSRCVWVLIRCAQPILLFAMKRTKGISDFFFRFFSGAVPPSSCQKIQSLKDVEQTIVLRQWCGLFDPLAFSFYFIFFSRTAIQNPAERSV